MPAASNRSATGRTWSTMGCRRSGTTEGRAYVDGLRPSHMKEEWSLPFDPSDARLAASTISSSFHTTRSMAPTKPRATGPSSAINASTPTSRLRSASGSTLAGSPTARIHATPARGSPSFSIFRCGERHHERVEMLRGGEDVRPTDAGEALLRGRLAREGRCRPGVRDEVVTAHPGGSYQRARMCAQARTANRITGLGAGATSRSGGLLATSRIRSAAALAAYPQSDHACSSSPRSTVQRFASPQAASAGPLSSATALVVCPE